MNNLLKSFVIGSSAAIFVPFYIYVSIIPESKINLKTYAIKAALYFGIMNMLATFLGKKYNLSLFQRLLLITIISIAVIWIALTIYKPYNFKTKNRWISRDIYNTKQQIRREYLSVVLLEGINLF